MKKFGIVVLVVVLVVVGVAVGFFAATFLSERGGFPRPQPGTSTPATDAPEITDPSSEPPASEPPVTQPPVTQPPTTQPVIQVDVIPIDPPVVMYATDDQVNIRMQPTTKADRYASLHKGDGVTVTGRTKDGWYRIIYRDIYTGYVFGEYLSETAIPNGITETPFQPPITMYATEDVNIRADHSTNATKLGVLPAGDSVLVLAETSNGWYRVYYQGKDAYISAQYLTKTKPTPAAG